MGTKRVGVVIVGLVLLARWAGRAWAEEAVTVDSDAVTYTSTQDEISIGWRFFVDQTRILMKRRTFPSFRRMK